MKAIHLFEDLEKGILHTIKAADLYAIHLVAIARRKEPDREQIRNLMTTATVSGFTVLGISYEDSEKRGDLLNIASQILLATYTALESYLINKLKEYVAYYLKAVTEVNSEMLLKQLSFRDLEEIKKRYKEILDIHLPAFEMDRIIVDEESSFKPSSTWDGLLTIEKARQEIAHQGKAKTYKIHILSDAWDPFDFVRRWVTLFDANFDRLIYENKSTNLITKYKKRLAEQNIRLRK